MDRKLENLTFSHSDQITFSLTTCAVVEVLAKIAVDSLCQVLQGRIIKTLDEKKRPDKPIIKQWNKKVHTLEWLLLELQLIDFCNLLIAFAVAKEESEQIESVFAIEADICYFRGGVEHIASQKHM